MSGTKKAICGFVLLSFILGCATSGYNKGQFNLYSIDDEKRIGQDFANQLLSEYGKRGRVYDDPETNKYINQLGQKLVSEAPEKKFDYHFYVLKFRGVNAFAVPGGHIFVFTGLINYSQNEAELSGVIAHEIAHIAARHGTEQMSAQLAASVASSVVLAGVGLSGVDPSLAQLALNVVNTGVFLSYSRKDESEADEIGAKMVYKAGYHPEGMKNFFDRLHNKVGDMSDLEVFLSTHPDPGDREKHIKDLIEEMGPTDNLKWDSKEFKEVKAKVSKIVYPKQQEKAAQSQSQKQKQKQKKKQKQKEKEK